MRHISLIGLMALFLTGVLPLTGCTEGQDIVAPPRPAKSQEARRAERHGKLFGDDFFRFGGPKKDDLKETSGIGVNSFLWRATLDTLAFMPLKSADPFGGVIMTEWYSAPQTPNERFKADVRIFDRQLRVDGLKVSIFKQKKSPTNVWEDVAVSPEVVTQIENAILAKARQLKQENL